MTDLFGEPAYQDPDEQLRELLERQHLILAMQQTDGWKLWADFLAAEAQGYQRRLLLGQHAELLDYRYDAGVLHGIRLALGVDDKLAQRVSTLRANMDTLSGFGGADPLANQETLTDE